MVVPSPEFYKEVLAELDAENQVSEETRRHLAFAAFRRTAEYDAAISGWLAKWLEAGDQEAEPPSDDFPEELVMRYDKSLSLRYGENPHQRAAYYARVGERDLLYGVERVQGKDLSFNNLHDVDAARALLAELGDHPSAVIVKHANPCGAAVADDVNRAYERALASDPLSAFGGIVALNAPVDDDLAGEITQIFTEVLIAPGFAPGALEAFTAMPNLTLLAAGPLVLPSLAAKDVTGGLLLQDADLTEDSSEYETVTEKRPTPRLMEDLLFAWRVAKRVRSNAIVLAREGATVGIGMGLTSRVDAAELAVRKAGERARGAVAASDAFFPFADGVEALAEAGITAVIQPGGSKRDEEVIEAANRHGIAMVFTGHRHFLH
jgi:phosphoribosylaminoimidazolecarboxamide formyltransferase/IMP cyclohydrolase